MTGNDIITSALRKLGAINVGDPVDAPQLAAGLDALNDMLEAWSIDRLTVFTEQSAQYALTANKATYTIGKDPANVLVADFNAVRPAKLTRAYLLRQGIKYRLDVLDAEQFAAIPYTFAAQPGQLYIDGGFPLRSITLDPIPDTGAYTLELWTWQPLQSFANGATKYYFPPAYGRALKNNLAIELAPEYDREPSPTLVKIAAEAKAAVENLNLESPVQQIDSAVLGRHGSRSPLDWVGNYR